jgi:hypothetical protein
VKDKTKQKSVKPIIGRCGYRCDLCLIYKDNLRAPQDRERFRNGLLKYFGYRMTLDECYCDGCLTPDSEHPILVTADCLVRPCVLAKGLENCASCDEYPCSKLQKKFIDYGKVRERYGAPIPDEDYRRFVMPYENKPVLEQIRQKAGLKKRPKGGR